MPNILNKNIKDIISDNPKIGDILNEYEIGCTACAVGTCQLKDVVEYHYLPDDKKAELWAKLGRETGEDIPLPPPSAAKTAPSGPRVIKYSTPMRMLVDEHKLIKRLLAIMPAIIENLDLETDEGRQIVLDSVDFIRNYADKFHHAKEEDILFKYFDENLDILKVMHEDHATGRNHVKCAIEGVEKRDRAAVAEHLRGYMELLTEHIKKEDEILYPWMDKQLTDKQIGEMFQKFVKVEQNGASLVPVKYKEFIEKVEAKYNK